MQFLLKRTLMVALLAISFFQAKSQVGIGTTSPSNALHVKDSTNPVRVEGFAEADSTYGDRIMVIDSSGVMKYAKLSTLMKDISQSGPVNSTTTSYTLGENDNVLIITAGSPQITLPAASSCYGRVYHIMKLSGGNSNYSTTLLKLDGNTVNNIPGKSADTILSDGVNWYRLHHTN